MKSNISQQQRVTNQARAVPVDVQTAEIAQEVCRQILVQIADHGRSVEL